MLVVEIELLADRYHATAWDRGANEGDPEWPPSPWRLARALVSAWWRTPVDARPDQHAVDRLLKSLAGPPRLLLPRGVPAHLRHYMPREGDNPTLVLDPFVRTDGGSVQMVWDHVDLADDDRELLDTLLQGVGYFGRAESPCIAGSIDVAREGGIAVEPRAADTVPDNADVVRVLCVAEDVSCDGLSESTAERRRKRLSSVPCGRWVSYVRPRSCLEPPRPTHRRPTGRPVVGLRFAVEGPAVPPLTEALRLAERFRAAALKRAHGASAATVLALRGRVEGQAPAEGHRHAHYLPTDEDGDHRIDHLTVWCPAGLDSDARRALDIVTLRSWAFDHPVTFVLLDELQDEPSTGPVGEGRTWRSHTPFVPTRHPKRRTGRVVDGVGDVLCLELSRRGFPMPVACIRLQAGQAHWAAFRRTRDRQPRPTTGAVGFELEFDQVVRGPLALGRNSHFGLGLFLPTGS